MCSYSVYSIIRNRIPLNIFNSFRLLHNVRNVTSLESDEISEEQQRLIKVSIIGLPNAGKSTLINNMMDRKVCPVSNKVHTTRKRAHAIITEGNTQIVFLDTPGIVSMAEKRKFNLERSFVKDCESSLQQANMIGVVHDVSNRWTRDKLDIKIIRLLERHKNKPSFLILNKIDELKSKRKLLDLTKSLTNDQVLNQQSRILTIKGNYANKEIRYWPYFNEVFMVSALFNDGVDDIKNYLINQAIDSPWMYPSTEWTDETPENIIVKTVQATFLDFLPQEIPYKLKTYIEFFHGTSNGTINAAVVVECPSERIKKLIAGVGDGKLRQMSEKIHRDLQVTFQTYVSIKIVLVCNYDKNNKTQK